MVLGQALTYKTKKFIKRNNASRSNVSFEKANQFGVIFSNTTPGIAQLAETLKKELGTCNKQVKVLAYDRNVEVKHLPFESFSRKDLNFWGSFTKSSIEHFANSNFDFLICLDATPSDVVQNVLARSQAKCRVGVCTNAEAFGNLFELIVHVANENNLVDSIYRYLKNIR